MLEIYTFDPMVRNHHEATPIFEGFYSSWKEIWNEEYLRLDSHHKWSSDTFTRQTHAVSVMWNGTFAASIFYRPLDLRSQIDRDDSFFAYWPTEVIDKLVKTNTVVLACTSFTVAKPFRKITVENYNMKDILGALTVHHLKKTGYSASVALTRNTRSVDKYLLNAGWESLGCIDFKNEPSEMLYFGQDSTYSAPANLCRLIESGYSSNQNNNLEIPLTKAA